MIFSGASTRVPWDLVALTSMGLLKGISLRHVEGRALMEQRGPRSATPASKACCPSGRTRCTASRTEGRM